jgi:two-component system cell cycle sensor histidine kinase/response regulator CckA
VVTLGIYYLTPETRRGPMPLSPTVLLTEATILVVDDEEPLRRYIGRALEHAGYHVLTARDGSEALGYLRKSRVPVQLVITDISMPGMTGLELASRIATEPFPPPVLFISGDHTLLDVPGAILRKPFLHRDLSPMVESLLRRPHHQVAMTIQGPTTAPIRPLPLPPKVRAGLQKN